jgi:hypothetical protein
MVNNFFHVFQTGYVVYPASYPMVTGGSVFEKKAVGA